MRLNDPDGGDAIDVMRSCAPLQRTWHARRVGAALDAAWGPVPQAWPARAHLTLGDLALALASVRLGRRGEVGGLVAGSGRPDFPTDTERVLLEACASQATIALQQARLLRLQSRDAPDTGELESRGIANAIPGLLSSERQLKLIIDTIPALAWSARPDGGAEYFNQHYLDYVALAPERARDWGWAAAVHPDDLDGLAATWQAIRASGRPGEAEARLRRHDGVYRWFLMRASPLRDESGSIVQWYGVNTDVEDRRRAEAELRRAYDHLTEAQRLSQTGSFTSDLQGDEETWSDEFYRICESEPGSPARMQRLRDIVHPEDVALFQGAVERALAGADVRFEFRIVTPRGTAKHLLGAAHRVEQLAGPVLVGALHDVTAGKVAEAALNSARFELAYVARVATLSTLAASIAHQVNQPLAGIVANASTCLRMLDAEPPNVAGARKTARRSIRDGSRAADVIAQLRALFTKREFTLERMDLNAATREVIALCMSEFQKNRVVVQPTLAEDLPPVDGDRAQLQQVLLTLFCNASEAMADVHDRPRLLVIRTEREDSDRVRVAVRDVGVGFDRQSADRLFDAFYSTKSSGLGIGLSVSRSIIERHRGRIEAEPNEGPGVTFWFSLPCQPILSSCP